MDQTNIFTTCEFTVFDKKGHCQYRKGFLPPLDRHPNPEQTGVIDNAMRLVLTDSLLDQVEIFAGNFMNTWKNDLVYGWDNARYGSGNP